MPRPLHELAMTKYENRYLSRQRTFSTNVADTEERMRVGEQLKELDQLRQKDFALRLAKIENDVAALERNHAIRLQTYGVNKP